MSIIDIFPKPEEIKDRTIPKGIKLKPKEYWCPYCYMPVVFKKDKRLGVLKCPVCGISNRDYWVKIMNSKIKK